MSDQRLLSIVSAVAALGYVVIGVSHFALPPTQLTSSPATLFASLATDGSTIFRLHYWCFAITSLLAVVLVLGYRPEGNGNPSLLLQATRTWALVAFSVTALEFLYVQDRALTISRHWNELDAGARSALLALGLGRLDPTWLLGFGIVGTWPAALSATALRAGAWPRIACYLGFGVGLAGLLVCVGALTGVFAFIDIAAAAGGLLLNPLWLGILAVHYGRSRSSVARPA